MSSLSKAFAAEKEKVKNSSTDKKKKKSMKQTPMMKAIGACVLVIALLFPSVSLAQSIYFAYTFEAITVSNTAIGFTASKLHSGASQANAVTFTVNCASGTSCVLRFTVDGTTPTASAGMRALYGSVVTLTGYNNNVNFRGIRETGTDVKLDVTYFR